MKSTTSTRQRQTQLQSTLQLQATSVIQNTISCGIAQICHSRNLFPPSFFRNVNVDRDGKGGGGGTSVVVFDLDDDGHGHGHGDDDMEELVAMSALTSEFDEQSHANGANTNANTNVNAGHHHHHNGSVDSAAIMKAEVRLLQHWIHGLFDLLQKDNQTETCLLRVVFGICRHAEEGNTNNNDDDDEDGDGGDELIESFVVSATTMLIHVLAYYDMENK